MGRRGLLLDDRLDFDARLSVVVAIDRSLFAHNFFVANDVTKGFMR
jgi:hypothetical protein